jgi:tRNA dimethylallyltransferase
MEIRTSQLPTTNYQLLAIVGPTASGKSDLALKIAQEFRSEIIAADSRTIYKHMDIGTAKPTKKEQELMPHWGLDLVEPGEIFSAYQFKKYAEAKIKEIQKRGNLPILVGGTGLYIDAVLFDFNFVKNEASEERPKLEKLSIEQLQNLIKKSGYGMPENYQNRRHLIRTVERKGKIGTKRRIKNNTLIIGLLPASEVLKMRIYNRAKDYFDNGILKETEYLMKKYSQEELKKTHGIAYAASIKRIAGEINEQEAVEMIQREEWQYARRQRTWLRRNKFIRWYESPNQAHEEIESILNPAPRD